MKVEIWSDYACPYCYIGKAHLDAALAAFEHAADVEVVFRAFELDPTAGREVATTTQGRIEQKYGKSPAAATEMIEGIVAMAARAGIDMRYADVRYTNTFDAHRLTRFAAEKGVGAAMSARLFAAYFTDRLPLADHGALVDLAAEVGLDALEVREMLATDRYVQECRGDEAEAQRRGIRGVPQFLVDGELMLGGAQPVEALLRALRTAWEKRHAKGVGSDGVPLCGADGCALPVGEGDVAR